MSQNGLPDGTKTGKGSIADEQTRATWTEAYRFYQLAPVETVNAKAERTERISYVALRLGVTRKVAKRRIKNYEGWQKRLHPGFKKMVPDQGRGGRNAHSGYRDRPAGASGGQGRASYHRNMQDRSFDRVPNRPYRYSG